MTTSFFFNGSIDQVIIWNRSLSAAEVLAVYRNSTKSTYYQNSSGSTITSPNKRYAQYRAFLETNDSAKTPTLSKVIIDYVKNYTADSYGNYTIPFHSPMPSYLGVHTLKVNITNAGGETAENSLNLTVWAPSNLTYTTVTEYQTADTSSRYNITVTYRRKDLSETISGLLNATIGAVNKTCTAGECTLEFAIGSSGDLRGGQYNVTLTAQNTSAYYRASAQNYTLWLYERTSTGNLIVPAKTISDMAESEYSFLYNVTVNNTAYSQLQTVTVNATSATGSFPDGTHFKDIVLSSTTCTSINISGSCYSTFNITMHGARSPYIDYYIVWRANWTNLDTSKSSDTDTHMYVDIIGNTILSIGPLSLNYSENLSATQQKTVTVNSSGNEKLDNVVVSYITINLSNNTITFTGTGNWLSSAWTEIGDASDPTATVYLYVNVTITNFTRGVYTGRLNITSEECQTQTINISVTISPQFNVTSSISVQSAHNSTLNANFTVNSTGNARVENISIAFVNDTMPYSWLSLNNFTPYITENNLSTIRYNITIPEYQLRSEEHTSELHSHFHLL